MFRQIECVILYRLSCNSYRKNRVKENKFKLNVISYSIHSLHSNNSKYFFILCKVNDMTINTPSN